MKTMPAKLTLLFLVATFGAAARAQSAPAVGLSGDRFIVDGQPTFILGVSYFDWVGWSASDLDAFQARQFNCIRIFVDYRPEAWDPSVAPGSRSGFNPDSSLRNSSSLLGLVRACAARGIIVDVTIFAGSSNLLSSLDAATRNVVRLLRNEPNVFYDMVNEHNSKSFSSHSALAGLIAAARQEDGDAVLMFSSHGDYNADPPGHIITSGETVNQANVNEELNAGSQMITPHLFRSADWYDRIDRRVATLKSYLSSIGWNVPVFLQEEARRGDGSPGAWVGRDQLLQAAREARDSGAAGYVFHTAAGFDLRNSTFFSNLDGEERAAIDVMGGQIFGTPPPTVRINTPAAGTVLSPGQTVTATGSGNNLSWGVDLNGDGLGYIATGAGPSITFTVPGNATSAQRIQIELWGDGGADSRHYDISNVSRGGPTPEEQVTGLYRELLGREPDPDGFAYWVNYLNSGGTYEDLRQIFLNSEEYRQRQQGGGGTSATVDFHPEADTYVYLANPGTNFGASPDVEVGGQSHQRDAFLRFNVALPAGAAVMDARLILRVIAQGSSGESGGTLGVFAPADPTWDEMQPSWNNPLAGADATGDLGTLGPVTEGQSYEFAGLGSAVGGNGRITFAIRSGYLDGAWYCSKDHPDASAWPVLRLTYATGSSAVAGSTQAASSGDSSGGGCGVTGLEFALLFLLIRALRR